MHTKPRYVSDCWIVATGDALRFKSEGTDVCENVLVYNYVSSLNAAISGFRRVTVTGCKVRR